MWTDVVIALLCGAPIIFMLFWMHGAGKTLEEKGYGGFILGPYDTLKVFLRMFFRGSAVSYEMLTQFTDTYSHVMLLRVPFTKRALINIADLDTAKRVLSSPIWTDRLPADHYMYESNFGKPYGLLMGNGPWWRESRNLTLKLLQQLDFFRQDNMEQIISDCIREETKEIDAKIKDGGGAAALQVSHIFAFSTLNIVYQVITGRRLGRHDAIVKDILSTLDEYIRAFDIGASIADVFPSLRHLPGVGFLKQYEKASQVCYGHFSKIIGERRRVGEFRKDPTTFTDHFMLEIEKHEGQHPNYITDEALLVSMKDLVFGASDSTNAAIEHGLLYLSLHSEIQEKVQTEIDDVIGQSTSRYDDRLKMPYTQAVLHEILRVSSTGPITGRTSIRYDEINNIFIAKGSLCLVNIYAIHRSKDIWEDPVTFRPERFIGENGEIVNIDKIIPFGYGKRICLAERVARITLLLFIVNLLHKYSFRISPHHPPPSFRNRPGLTRSPMPFHVEVRIR